jgi:hypothetical protein
LLTYYFKKLKNTKAIEWLTMLSEKRGQYNHSI